MLTNADVVLEAFLFDSTPLTHKTLYICPHTTIYASSYCRDATLVLEAFLFDSTPLTHQVMTKLCSSLITVPPRVKLMKRHTEMSEIFEKSLLPQATDARSFGHEVIHCQPAVASLLVSAMCVLILL